MREKIIKLLYKLFPFSLKGDAAVCEASPDIDVSCMIITYGRPKLLSCILSCLADQDLECERFEVIVVEDKGGTEEGEALCLEFRDRINLVYLPAKEGFGLPGRLRNMGLEASCGRYILFLDDDTIILERNFLRELVRTFKENREIDAVLPRGKASYSVIEGRYSFHDPHFFTNRGVAYRREVLRELGGFVSDFVGQEDVEFTIRFLAAGKRAARSEALWYMHPPLILNSLRKPMAVGVSFARLRKRYPLIVWLACVINSSRYLPLILFPSIKMRMQGRFSLGFFLGVLFYPFLKNRISYG